MFNRSSMATVIADSTASFNYHGEPNADSKRLTVVPAVR